MWIGRTTIVSFVMVVDMFELSIETGVTGVYFESCGESAFTSTTTDILAECSVAG